jgi:hypothetical protein
MLMTRDNFRESVFARDNYRCVYCGEDGVDAHHIMERRLFKDGGYYEDNGATLCGDCHWEAERTSLTPDDIRDAAGITTVVLPEHLYSDQEYTKWGDPVLPNGQRLKGELFDDPSVQKVIKDFLHLYTDYVKYPRTYHLPWSENITDDDRVMENPEKNFDFVVVTEKMDGENTTMYQDYIHARSLDGRSHKSRDWVKNFHSQIAHDIPKGWRICGENMYAVHSIKYSDLKTYFYGFSIWNDKNECLSWAETLEWFWLLGIEPVPTIYVGEFSEDLIKKNWWPGGRREREGYVVRNFDSFHYRDFRNNVAKYVRKDHVQTVKHWFYGQQIERNDLANQR